MFAALDIGECVAGSKLAMRENAPCVTMISAAATTSKTVATTAAAAGGGGGFGLPMGGGGLGIGTIIVLGLICYAFGIDPRILIGGAEILNGGGSQAPSYQTDRRSGPAKTGAPTDEMGSMIAGILGEIDDRWSEIFQASGQSYTGPNIVLFRNATNGGRCGMAQSAMGPFYCPPDQTDLSRHRILPRGRDAVSRLLGQCLQVHRGLYHRP